MHQSLNLGQMAFLALLLVFLLWLVFSWVVGFVARKLVPGRNRMKVWGTVALGIVGTILGSFVKALLFGNNDNVALSLIAALLGSMLVLAIYNALRPKRYPIR